jgi:hypothetical protein
MKIALIGRAIVHAQYVSVCSERSVTWVPPRKASGVATKRNARMPKPTGRTCRSAADMAHSLHVEHCVQAHYGPLG